MHRHRTGWSVTLIAMTTVTLLGACSSQVAAPSSPTSASTAALPSGSKGAARFAAGYLVIGSGTKTVDLYLDPMCPYCRQFEQSNGQMLFQKAQSGELTLRLHPLAILDRLSSGTKYSTRSAAAITEVAADDPAHLVAFVTQLFAKQPAENSTGLTDDQLAALASGVGTALGPSATRTRYRAWVHEKTAQALTGPLPGSVDLAAVQAVPTVLVNGHHFLGDSDRPDAFTAFYDAH